MVLSEQARKNLGLQLMEVKLSDFWRTIAVPGVVAEQPGHSERRVTTMVHGVILAVHVLPGQSKVLPGSALRHSADQRGIIHRAIQFAQDVAGIELNETEMKRIEPLVRSGSLPEKNRLELEYEKTRLEAARRVQAQELLESAACRRSR
ncbi:MAG: hypothetical protein U1D30_03895 [Planctomycetota bacterium]